MHELSIAATIIETVTDEIISRKLGKVTKIGLKIGALTDIVPDALTFGFDTLKKDSPLKDASLEIESVPVMGQCQNCSKKFEVREFIFICPECESVNIITEQGKELDITYLEIDDT